MLDSNIQVQQKQQGTKDFTYDTLEINGTRDQYHPPHLKNHSANTYIQHVGRGEESTDRFDPFVLSVHEAHFFLATTHPDERDVLVGTDVLGQLRREGLAEPLQFGLGLVEWVKV